VLSVVTICIESYAFDKTAPSAKCTLWTVSEVGKQILVDGCELLFNLVQRKVLLTLLLLSVEGIDPAVSSSVSRKPLALQNHVKRLQTLLFPGGDMG
jgi:hypothetical protein